MVWIYHVCWTCYVRSGHNSNCHGLERFHLLAVMSVVEVSTVNPSTASEYVAQTSTEGSSSLTPNIPMSHDTVP